MTLSVKRNNDVRPGSSEIDRSIGASELPYCQGHGELEPIAHSLLASTYLAATHAPMTSGALALVRSAFGRSATLYDALQCPGGKDASQQQLKKCYRRVALCFHPDKCRFGADDKNREQLLRESTLKFQAASASYEVLSDARRRAIYDATGRIDDEQDVHDGRSSPGSASQSKADDQKRWDEFFRSVFHEVMSSGSRHGDADSYRGSKEEEADAGSRGRGSRPGS